MNKSPITIINDENMRGIIAPASTLSKKTLEEIVDFIELSSPEAVKAEERLIRDADGDVSWIPFVPKIRRSPKKKR